jgi:predicted nucleic acid-binding protein
VLTEILSDHGLPKAVGDLLKQFPLLGVKAEFWLRAGELRAKVLAKGRKARLGDALIAQQCIDHNIPLATRDRDFKVFAAVSTLRIL